MSGKEQDDLAQQKRMPQIAKRHPKLNPQRPRAALGWQEARGRRCGAERRLPFLAVLSHAHAAPVPGSGAAAGPLAHLEADPTGGAARRPRGPGGPASVPGDRRQRGHEITLAQSPSPVCAHLR